MSTSLPQLQKAFARICLDEQPAKDDFELLYDEEESWSLYRRMVRHRIFKLMASALPRTKELLGPERFDAAITSYLAGGGPRTRFFRELAHELVAHALPGWEADTELPEHLSDLVRYEDAKWRVASLPWELSSEPAELDFESKAVVNPTLRLVPVWYWVDRNPQDPHRLKQPHTLALYRKPGGSRIYTWVLNDIGGRLLKSWCADQSCAEGVRQVLSDLKRQPDERFVDSMAGVLSDLVDETVILGSIPK